MTFEIIAWPPTFDPLVERVREPKASQ